MDKPGKNEELGTLVRSTRLAVPNYLSGGVITCLAVDDKLNMAAIGFSNHCLLLLRGDITRDRGTKQKILLDASKPPSKTQSHDTDISKSYIRFFRVQVNFLVVYTKIIFKRDGKMAQW